MKVEESAATRGLRIVGMSGSLRRASTNSAALEALVALAPPGASVAIYRGLKDLPAFDPDDDDGVAAVPAAVEELRALVRASDGLLIAMPEYAHGVPGAFKNALDWLVSSEAFPGKPVALINTAPRAFHAQSALRETLATMSARLIPEAFVSLPLTGKQLTAEDILADRHFATPLREALDRFFTAIRGDAR